MDKAKVISAIAKLKENENRKFDESIDLIINLRSFDIKRENINLTISLPHNIRKAKVIGLLTKKSQEVETITKEEFDKYADKKKMKKLIESCDFFLSSGQLMPTVAAKFGKYLGQAGKMPSPQLGIVMVENDEEIKKILPLFDKVIKVKSKESSLKFLIGKKSMKEEDVADNIIIAYNAVVNALTKREQNIKNIMIKLTMSKPIKLEL